MTYMDRACYERGCICYDAQDHNEYVEVVAKQEQGEPVAWVDLLKEAQQIVESKFLWKRFIDGTPLANDIACWMADFAQQHTTPQQRTWEGLSVFEINDLVENTEYEDYSDLVERTESKLKEKNNG